MPARQRINSKQDWVNYINAQEPRTFPDLRDLRKSCYKDIEEIRNRPLLVYYSRFPNASSSILGAISIDLSDIEAFTDLVNSVEKGDSIDVLIHSPGGYPDATERIVHILRKKFKEVHFLIPHSAYSAATMLALSGNSITLHPSAILGPIDPQIDGIPARSMKRGFEKIRDKIQKEGPEALPAYIPLIEQYSIHLLEQCDDALQLSKDLVKEWLTAYMVSGDTHTEEQIEEVVTYFSNYEEHLTHSRPIFLSKTQKFGLSIFEAEPDLAHLLWEAHLLIEGFFESSTFVKLFENSHEVSWGIQGQATTP